MELYLRKVIHPQAHDNYRVILKLEDGEFEIGSVFGTGSRGVGARDARHKIRNAHPKKARGQLQSATTTTSSFDLL